jgi:ribosomal small subunit protein bTHX
MGRGDKKTAKGKRTIGSYGVSRPKKKSTYPASTAVEKGVVEEKAAKKPAAKKPAAKKPAAKKATKAKEEAEK